jgi:CubicO group peptidase (beta-lactamase class C family)
MPADTPVQRYLPWFRVADAQAFARISLRHLLNQTSGFSRAPAMAPLLEHSNASIRELTRNGGTAAPVRSPGERFEYNNLNFIILGAVLEVVTGRRWDEVIQNRVFRPLGMSRSRGFHALAREDGVPRLHRMCFGVPVSHEPRFAPGVAPAGGLVASASDMTAYLRMLLAEGMAESGGVISSEAVRQLLAGAPLIALQFARLRRSRRRGAGP